MNDYILNKKLVLELVIGVFISFFVAWLFWFNPVQASSLKGYEALQVISTGSGTLQMEPQEKKQFMIEFKNIGQKTWVKNGAEFVSIYTYNPKYRTSVFQDSSWYRKEQPVLLKENEVKVGETGHIYFTLEAPSKEGNYHEMFRLAAEDVAWIPGGEFVVNIRVGKKENKVEENINTEVEKENQSNGLSAVLLLRSAKKIVARGGEVVKYRVGIKNTGTQVWHKRQIKLPDIVLASVGDDTYHSSWLTSTQLVLNDQGEVNSGALDFIDFTFTAPRTQGMHKVSYQLAVDGQTVPNFSIDIPIEVTSNAPKVINAPVRSDIQPVKEEVYKYDHPLMLKVGVLIVDEETDNQVEISCRTDWELRDIKGALLGELEKNKSVKAFYKNGRYYFDRGRGLEKSTFALRFIPKIPNEVCTVENFDRRVTRNYTHPDNTFRNVLELHYNDYKDRTWLINELPMDYYLKGLGETSNISHLEYQKALITAARTYATYHWERNTKRVKEFFHVTAYADDQVYRGYGQEQRSPRIVQSVDDSRGQIVTYDNELALTPYYSRSDGRTRGWSEVWYGDVAWLKSVPCPCDKSKNYPLWGHGVGMSATEALCQANNGKKYEDILKYFYQDIELKKFWK